MSLVRCISLACMALLACLLVGCSPAEPVVEQSSSAPVQGIPSWATEEDLLAHAQQVIADFDSENYEALASASNGLLTTAQLQPVGTQIAQALGDCTSFGDAAYLQGTDSSGAPYATVVQEVLYDRGNALYTVSFSEDGTLVGFYVRLPG